MTRGKNKNEETQKVYLLSLVQAAYSGKDWETERVGWSSDSNETVCAWTGIECGDDNSTVITIDIRDSELGGTLPPELGHMPMLKHLILVNNEFFGTIPLKYFNLPSLETLNLRENQLEGSFPHFMSAVMNTFDISHNRFQGTLPSNIGDLLPNMKLFDASHNGLLGTIPYSFGNMEGLGFLDLSENRFDGTIPVALGNLKNLQGLFLDHNKLIGTIPVSLTRSENKLVQIFLESNYLSGTVPVSLGDLPYLKDLFIDENKFTGTLPQEICDQNLNEAFFENTEYDTPDRDGCESVACPVNTMSKEGTFPCLTCGPQLENPYLGRAGRCYHRNERMILNKFFDTCGGIKWKNSIGWGLDNVAQCEFEGITCNPSGHVVNITLADSGVSGILPEEIGFLKHLRVLNLANNNIEGQIPASLRFPPLEELDISGNKFTGYVPPMLCLTGGINGNGEGRKLSCDFIACSTGFSSPTGYASYTDSGGINLCTPCSKKHASNYLGSKSCGGTAVKNRSPKIVRAKESRPKDNIDSDDGSFLGITMFLFAIVGLAVYIKKYLPGHLNSLNVVKAKILDRLEKPQGHDDSYSVSSSQAIGDRFNDDDSMRVNGE